VAVAATDGGTRANFPVAVTAEAGDVVRRWVMR
jgi:hypothetical protein